MSASHGRVYGCLFASVIKQFLNLGRVGVAAVGNQVYAIGGYDGVSNLSSMEVYDIQREEWLPAPHMRKHYGAVGVAAIT